MKKIILFLVTTAFLSTSWSQSVLVPAFEVEVIGNVATVTNTSILPAGWEITYMQWYVSGEEISSTEEQFTYTISNICDEVYIQLSIYVDSLTIPMGGGTYGEYIDYDGLEAIINVNIDEATQVVTLSPSANGGSVPYTYTWTIGDEVVLASEVIFPFGEEPYYSANLCVIDVNGCTACNHYSEENPFLDCTLTLDITTDGNLVNAWPHLMLGTFELTDWQGMITDPDTVSYAYGISPVPVFTTYVDELGIYEWCVSLDDWSMNFFEGCPAETCQTFEITSFSNDCAAFFDHAVFGPQAHFVNESTGYYTDLLWDLGDGTTSDAQSVIHTYLPGTYLVTLTVSNPDIGCSSIYTENITVFEPAHLCGFVYIDENGNGVYDGEDWLPDTVDLYFQGQYIMQSGGGFDAEVVAGADCIYIENYTSYILTSPSGFSPCEGGFYIELDPAQNVCPLEIGLMFPVATVCGTMYYDSNNNGSYDALELPIAFEQINVDAGSFGNLIVVTDANGAYCVEVPLAELIQMVPTFSLNPAATITPFLYENYFFTTDTFNNVNFGVYDSSEELDLGINLTSSNTPIIGGWIYYYVQAHNYSNVTSTATISLVFDPGQSGYTEFGYSLMDDPGSTFNPDDHSISWNVTMLPYQTQNFSLITTNNLTLSIGDQLTVTADITATGTETDVATANNFASNSQVVVSSFDPNNKLVQPMGSGDEGKISPLTDDLTYTINFQNTGTSPAINIIITDELDEDLDPSTIQILGASHNVQSLIDGNNITWTFNNIMLADSFSNEAESHGYVLFRISPDANLPDQTAIENTANIYFDFNEAVVTNTALNTIEYALGTHEISISDNVSIYPNPAGDIVSVEIKEQAELRVFDTQGRIIHSQPLKKSREMIDTSSWSAGFYTFSITTFSGISSHCVVKR